MSSDRMRLEDTNYLRYKYLGEDLGGHYLGCWKEHIGCAIEKLLGEVDALRADISKLDPNTDDKAKDQPALPPVAYDYWDTYHD